MSIYDDIAAAIVNGQPVSKAAFRAILEEIADLANAIQSIETVAGTSYQVTDADHGKLTLLTSSSPLALEFAKTLSVGKQGLIKQVGTGIITCSAESGGTLSNGYGFTKSFGQNAKISWLVSANSDGNSAVVEVEGNMAP